MKSIYLRYFFVTLFTWAGFQANAQFVSNVYWTEQTNLPLSETIYYSRSRPLKWTDFKGLPDHTSKAAAITSSGFGYKADFKSVGTKSQLNIGVYCYFSKKTSWVKEGKTTSYILNHEQQHFDISFIAASLFLHKLKTYNLTKENYKEALPRIYNESVAIMNKMQHEYDDQTKNGQLKDLQAKWEQIIGKQLAETTK